MFKSIDDSVRGKRQHVLHIKFANWLACELTTVRPSTRCCHSQDIVNVPWPWLSESKAVNPPGMPFIVNLRTWSDVLFDILHKKPCGHTDTWRWCSWWWRLHYDTSPWIHFFLRRGRKDLAMKQIGGWVFHWADLRQYAWLDIARSYHSLQYL